MKTLLSAGCIPSLAVCLLFLLVAPNAQTAQVEVKHPPGDFVVANGAKLWCESEGKGEPLVLIAGGPGFPHGGFHPFLSSLADSNRVIYFDAFGRGKSDRAKASVEYTFERDVDDVEALRKALGLGKINLLGHSYGGMVAQAYALKYPESVKRLILANTLLSGEMWQANNDNCNHEMKNQCPETWEKVEKVRTLGHHSSAKEHQEVYQIPLGLLYFYDASNADKLPSDFNPEVYYAIAGDDADFFIGGDLAKLDFRTQLKSLKMPTLVMIGRYDRVALPKFALRIRDYMPQAQLAVFEKSGHFPFIEENGETIKVLREFLDR